MARYTVEHNYVDVVGGIWMPYGAKCAMRYDLTRHDVESIGPFTCENVAEWLTTHSGDFSSLDDFRATVGDVWIEWEDPDSEYVFNDCMYPELAEDVSIPNDGS